MNNSFDIHRFGKLVWHDVRHCSPRFSTLGTSLLGILWFVPVMILVNGITGQTCGVGYRLIMVAGISLVMASMIPMQLYANVGRKQKRGDIYFAMLPASKWEKYLSIALLSIVIVPFVLIAFNVALDTLLTAVHMPFYHKYMWQADLGQWINIPMLCNGMVAFVGPTLGFIYANAIRGKGWRSVSCFLLCLWLMGSMFGGVVLFNELENKVILWGIVAVQVLLAILLGFLGWDKMNKMGY